MGKIMMVWLESVKNIKILPCQKFVLFDMFVFIVV